MDEYEIVYEGKTYIVTADCRKCDDNYPGSNTFSIDIASVRELVSPFNEVEVDLNDINIFRLSSEVAYLVADNFD